MTFEELVNESWEHYLEKFRQEPSNLQTKELREEAAARKIGLIFSPESHNFRLWLPGLVITLVCLLSSLWLSYWLNFELMSTASVGNWKRTLLFGIIWACGAVVLFIFTMIGSLTIGEALVARCIKPAKVPSRDSVPYVDYILPYLCAKYSPWDLTVPAQTCQATIGAIEQKLGELNTVLASIAPSHLETPGVGFAVESVVRLIGELSYQLMTLYKLQERIAENTAESQLEAFSKNLQRYSNFARHNVLAAERDLEGQVALATEVDNLLQAAEDFKTEVIATIATADELLEKASADTGSTALHIQFLRNFIAVLEESQPALPAAEISSESKPTES